VQRLEYEQMMFSKQIISAQKTMPKGGFAPKFILQKSEV